MSIYSFLEKRKKRRKGFDQTEEFAFYIKHRDVLLKMPRFSFLINSENNEFNIIRANIIIQSYLNKVMLEEEISSLKIYKDNDITIDKHLFLNVLKEKMIDKPYFVYNNSKLFIPIFNAHLNRIYLKEPEKILNYPYNNLLKDFSNSVIDLFDVYGPSIYDSYFTRLVNIGTNGREIAFFHYDTNTIYIVNAQGRLDHKIVLFDKYIKRPVFNHMLERLKPVTDAYFSESRTNFVQALYDSNFISEKLYNMVKRGDMNGK